jgi:hypothetical protein
MSESDSSNDSAEEIFRRQAVNAAAQQKQKSAGKQKATHQQRRRADESDEDESAPGRKGKGTGKTVSGGGTQYEQWKNKHGKNKSNTADSDEEEDEHTSSRGRASGSQRQQQRDAQQQQQQQQSSSVKSVAIPREPKVARVPIKVERAKATRQADIDSGVAGALRELAGKKKLKQMKKKAKRAAVSLEEEEEEEESEDGEKANQQNSGEDEEDVTSHHAAPVEVGSEHTGADSPSDASETGDAEVVDGVEENMYAYREQHSIRLMSLDENVISSDVLDSDPLLGPVTDFSALDAEFGLDSRLVTASIPGFIHPTPIQAQCWPILLGGKDVIGVAQTGSGVSCLTFILAFDVHTIVN